MLMCYRSWVNDIRSAWGKNLQHDHDRYDLSAAVLFLQLVLECIERLSLQPCDDMLKPNFRGMKESYITYELSVTS